MARYFSRRRGRTRRRMYIISALVVIAAVIAFVYLFGKNESEISETLIDPALRKGGVDASVESKADLPVPVPGSLEIVPELTVEPNPKAAELIAEADALIDARPAQICKARSILNDALPMPMSQQQREVVKQRLSGLADSWLFSRRIFPQDGLCGSYKVKPGDQLRTIGEEHKVPYEILMEINGISRPDLLQAGEVIKVINGPFHTRVYRSSFTMDLYLQNTFVRSFPVGLGKPGKETPTGLWRLKRDGKLISPTWTDPVTGKTYEAEDPDYPLGSRWIGLKGLKGDAVGRTGIAFHGWKNSDLMAEGGSQGCIRLHNGDAILLYNLLVPVHSLVEVVE